MKKASSRGNSGGSKKRPSAKGRSTESSYGSNYSKKENYQSRDKKKSFEDKGPRKKSAFGNDDFTDKKSFRENKPFSKKDSDFSSKSEFSKDRKFGDKFKRNDKKEFGGKFDRNDGVKKSYRKDDDSSYGSKSGYNKDRKSGDKFKRNDKKEFGGKFDRNDGVKKSYRKDDDSSHGSKFGYNKDRKSKSEFDGEKNYRDKKPFTKKGYGDDSSVKRDSKFKKDAYSNDSKSDKKFVAKKEGFGDRKKTFRTEWDSDNRDFNKKKDANKSENFKSKAFEHKKEGGFARKKQYGNANENDFENYENHEQKKKSFERGKNEYNRLIKKSEKNLRHKEESKGDGSIRLNRYLANAGICSRRDADKLIESGAVTVNGMVVTQMGTKIGPHDKVQYGGQSIKTERLVYILLNKPKDYITTMDDPQGRKTVMGLIRGACKERVYPVGRLDRNTTGILLFTNDGELTKRLTHPKFLVSKMYHVEVDKNFDRDHLNEMRNGLELEDGFVKPDQLEYSGETKRELGIEIHSGRNRIVRRMFEHLGYDVIKLDRVMFAGLNKKDTPRGKWRFLNEKEVGFLKML